MNNLDPITLLKQEFEVKLQTMAQEFSETLQEIHVALTGITRANSMALHSLRADIEDIRKLVDNANKPAQVRSGTTELL